MCEKHAQVRIVNGCHPCTIEALTEKSHLLESATQCETWRRGDTSLSKCLKCLACLAEEVKIRDNEIERLKSERDELARQVACLKVEKQGLVDTGLKISADLNGKLGVALLQVRDFERAINAHCSCGGAGPGDGCVACEIYHDATGTKRGTEKRLCSDGQCKFEVGHEGDHVVNLRRRSKFDCTHGPNDTCSICWIQKGVDRS